MKRTALAIACAVLTSACGIDRQYEQYPNAKTWPDVQFLTRANHPHGYGRADCYSCHVRNNIHQVNTTQANEQLLDFARRLDSDETSCLTCHDNGVQ